MPAKNNRVKLRNRAQKRLLCREISRRSTPGNTSFVESLGYEGVKANLPRGGRLAVIERPVPERVLMAEDVKFNLGDVVVKPRKARIGIPAQKGPVVSAVVKKFSGSSGIHAKMSTEEMMEASEVLSAYQNGVDLGLDNRSPKVSNYVANVIKSGKIDDELTLLNRQIVCRTSNDSKTPLIRQSDDAVKRIQDIVVTRKKKE